MNNFTKLHEVLTNIGIEFQSQKAKEIMEGKKGVITKLLYQIRSTLEKKGLNVENLSLKKCNDYVNP
jgi:hypothetical protein